VWTLLAAGLLLAGASPAWAAGMAQPSSNAKMSGAAPDMLTLTTEQQIIAWKDLSSGAQEQNAPSGFLATVSSVLPATIRIEPVPSKTATYVPSFRPYDFALVQGNLLIVNPTDKKIAEVIPK
jgi:hypothetical protein